MSHIVTIQTEIRDINAIRAACKRMGWELVEGQQKFRAYYGHRNLCAHAIKVPGAEYRSRRTGTPGTLAGWPTSPERTA